MWEYVEEITMTLLNSPSTSAIFLGLDTIPSSLLLPYSHNIAIVLAVGLLFIFG